MFSGWTRGDRQYHWPPSGTPTWPLSPLAGGTSAAGRHTGPRQEANKATVRHQKHMGVGSLGSDPELKLQSNLSLVNAGCHGRKKKIHPPIGKTPPALDSTGNKSHTENH